MAWIVLASTTGADAKALQKCHLATVASLTRASGSSELQSSAWGSICSSTDTAELRKKKKTKKGLHVQKAGTAFQVLFTVWFVQLHIPHVQDQNGVLSFPISFYRQQK